eukprot:5153067-Amphidinium_carterae.1
MCIAIWGTKSMYRSNQSCKDQLSRLKDSLAVVDDAKQGEGWSCSLKWDSLIAVVVNELTIKYKYAYSVKQFVQQLPFRLV